LSEGPSLPGRTPSLTRSPLGVPSLRPGNRVEERGPMGDGRAEAPARDGQRTPVPPYMAVGLSTLVHWIGGCKHIAWLAIPGAVARDYGGAAAAGRLDLQGALL